MEEILQYLTANSNTPVWFVIMIFVIAFILLIFYIDRFFSSHHYKLDLEEQREMVIRLEYEVNRKESLLRKSIKEVNVLRDMIKKQNSGLTTLEAPQTSGISNIEEFLPQQLAKRGKVSQKSPNRTGKV